VNRDSALKDPSVELLVAKATDELIECLNRGEQPEIEDYEKRYPQIASIIRQVFPALQLMRASTSGDDSSKDRPTGDASVTGHLGDYRIVREVGRGGMGVVYEAEQVSLGRRVALKVLPFAAVLDQRQLQRFKNEAQAAAQLHHTNIVPVFSVGCERGVHYYAMQYIEGSTLAEVIHELRRMADPEAAQEERPPSRASELAMDLTSGRFVAQKGSSTDARLCENAPTKEGSSAALEAIAPELSTKSPAFFRSVANLGVQAAEALEHAHELGVVHRDIKPSNLLLDARGNLWITDFGLARLESDPGLTMTGDVLGTVRYMSPEQALGKHLLLDHRTDIYSLGVTLYELLTLRPALDGRDRQELLRKVADEEPRLPRRLNSAIPADLETIVLKATAKEPERRYATAKEMAADLERFLGDKPIQAKRPTLVQRAAKWSRRHRAVVASGVVLLIMAVIALSVSTVLIWQEQDRTAEALTRAEENFQTAEAERQRAEEERQRAEGNFELACEAVDQMLTRVAEELAGQPHMEQVRRELLEDALAFYEQFLAQKGDEPTVRFETARAYRRVGGILSELAEMDRSERALRQAIALFEALTSEHPDSADYRSGLGQCHMLLGRLLDDTSRPDEAREQYHACLRLREALVRDFPSEPEFRAQLATAHAFWAEDPDGPEQREQALRQAVAIMEELVQEQPDARDYRRRLAGFRFKLGALLSKVSLDEAERLIESSIAIAQELLAEDPDDPGLLRDLAMFQNWLGGALFGAGRADEAVEYFRGALETGERLVTDYPAVPRYQNELGAQLHNLGSLLSERGQLEEAAALLERAIEHQRAAYELNPLNPQYALFLRNHSLLLAEILTKMGNHVDAAAAALQAPEVMPEDHLTRIYVADQLSNCLRLAERDETLSEARRAALMIDYAGQAAEFLREAVPRLPDDAGAYSQLAWFLATTAHPRLRDAAQAVTLAERAVELAPEEGLHWNTLGAARYRAGDWSGAMEALNKSVELRDGGDAYDWLFLAMAHWQLGDRNEARRWYNEAIEWVEEKKPLDEQLQRFRAEAAELMGEE
jgi:serine/threonine protein kinase/Flp pilus assembly protein TadD